MTKSLRQLIAAPEILLAPGVYDSLSALIAEQSGAQAVYLSGASIAYTRLGRSDIGLVSMTEVSEIIGLITERINVPLIVDADNGFGNALNVRRTVREFEKSGAAAIQLEDQTFPKRCGHLSGKTVISPGEMVGKIHAALDARRNAETLVIARTDAISVEGFDSAMERAALYVEAGADVLFVEAPAGRAEMEKICSEFRRVPLMANMVEGGQTEYLTAEELREIGFSMVIFPGGLVRAVSKTMQEYFSGLLRDGSNALMAGRMNDFDGLNEIIGTAGLLELGNKYQERIK